MTILKTPDDQTQPTWLVGILETGHSYLKMMWEKAIELKIIERIFLCKIIKRIQNRA